MCSNLLIPTRFQNEHGVLRPEHDEPGPLPDGHRGALTLRGRAADGGVQRDGPPVRQVAAGGFYAEPKHIQLLSGVGARGAGFDRAAFAG